MFGVSLLFRRSVNSWISAQIRRHRAIVTRLPSFASQCVPRRIFVQTPDDEKFERYLKQFRPLAAEPLPVARPKRPTVRWFVPVSAAGAVIMGVAVLGLHSRPKP